METTILIAVIVLLALAVFIIIKINSIGTGNDNNNLNKELILFKDRLEQLDKKLEAELRTGREENYKISQQNREELSKSLKEFGEQFEQNTKGMNEALRQRFSDFGQQQEKLSKRSADSLKDIKETIEKQLRDIRTDNEKQLGEMRKTVDEKLQDTLEKRLGESFKQVSERLEQVHKGLGEMQTIATGVGDLKKVLSNVKTRGVLGEYMLENILEQLLAPEQYDKNVATKKGSRAFVEFAIRLPGRDSDEEVWLPIDSKFPRESYEKLLNAYDKGEPEEIELAQKPLLGAIESFAKDINEKYVDPPHTTDFAIMFLPVESLYGEVLRHPGLFETLQRKYRITITGPTTLSALLNSLQMGFRTLAVQKKSSEVWKILEAVKTEFGKFKDQLDLVDKQLDTATKSLTKLRTTRTNVMTSKLKNVSILDYGEAMEVLDIDENAPEVADDEEEENDE